MSENLPPSAPRDEWIDSAVEAAELDYVGIDRLHTVVTRDLARDETDTGTQRVAAVLGALLHDPRVVVVKADDMLTPVDPDIVTEYRDVAASLGRPVYDGAVAWVLSRATWERDVDAAKHDCPVCAYHGFTEPPWDGDSPSDDICPGCGTQFGYHDSRSNVVERRARWSELRDSWVAKGRPWTSTVDPEPADWPPSGTTPDT